MKMLATIWSFLSNLKLLLLVLFLMLPHDIIKNTLAHEGGWSDHPSDKGGATNFGITLRTYQLAYPNATKEDLRNLTLGEAATFYEAYYDKFKVDAYPESIRDIVFDLFVNHSPKTAAKIIQRALARMGAPITVDGQIGPQTLSAADVAATHAPKEFRTALNDTRQEHFDKLIAKDPSQAVFKKGWKRRVDSFRN